MEDNQGFELNGNNFSMTNAIAIVDLGGQYCHLISRRLRDLGVHSHICSPETSPDVLSTYRGIILSGGPRSVYEEDAPRVNPDIIKRGIPILGICYGHQLLAQMLGAKVEQWSSEYGSTQLSVVNQAAIFTETPQEQTVWMSHTDTVTWLPPEITTLASTQQCQNAAFGNLSERFYGVQFHPEVVHTDQGKQILRNFAFKVCRLTATESPQDRVERIVEEIQTKVGKNSVFFLLSGGVDSTVAFALCAKALPRDRILGVHVDTGLMRKKETEEFVANLESLGLADRLRIRSEAARFLAALRDATEPEKKRHIIGRLFVDVQADAMQELGIDEDHWLLGQGTIYPDTIESGGRDGRAALIKTHHNRCAEIMQLIEKGRVIEPLAEFYKDEVRQIGEALGLDPKLTNRWPFPGPGLAIRCLCNTQTMSALSLDPEISRQMDSLGYEASLLPIQSVGVQGDSRTYRRVVALRGTLDYEALESISTELCNVHTATNRVIVFVSGHVDNLKKGSVIRAKIDKKRLAILQESDFIARSVMEQHGLTDEVWQFPVILIPVSFNGGESIILRPVNSEDGMTANFAKLPVHVIQKIATEITAKLSSVNAVFLDVTNKPPATIEWE